LRFAFLPSRSIPSGVPQGSSDAQAPGYRVSELSRAVAPLALSPTGITINLVGIVDAAGPAAKEGDKYTYRADLREYGLGDAFSDRINWEWPLMKGEEIEEETGTCRLDRHSEGDEGVRSCGLVVEEPDATRPEVSIG
jgi:hypothetical protein